MKIPNRARLALVGSALGVIIALVAAPQTRLLLRMQVFSRSALKVALNGCPTPQAEQFVRSHPGDYQIQLAAPFDTQTQTQVQHARSLVPRFPGSASLRANILRYATLRDLKLYRDEDYLLLEQPAPKIDPRNREQQPSTPAQIAAFNADAAAGERLDPDNAYFPFMQSVGLFAAHRDAEGLAAVERASRKGQWRDYSEDDIEGHWRINDYLNGGREVIVSSASAASLLLPHYARLRAVARIVTYKAVLEEQAGHPLEGLALRRALARCGYLMTTQSTYFIGNLVGTAISEVARSRPGGAPPWKSGLDAPRDKTTREQLLHQRLDAYIAYLRRLGQEDAAQETLHQFQGEQEVRQTPTMEYMMGEKTTDFMRLLFSLASGWALVTNFLTTILLGLAGWGLSRLPSIREGRPLPGGAGVGAGVALLLALAGLFFFHDTRPQDVGNLVLTVLIFTLIPLAALAIFGVLYPPFRKPLLRGVLAGLMIMATLFALVAFSAWEMSGAAELLDLANGGLFSDNDDQNRLLQTPLAAVAGLAVPLLLGLICMIAARVRRIPVSVGLVQSICTAALPVLCILTFLYGGLLLWTARQESAANYALTRSIHGEGQYLAELAGQKWPGQ